MTRTSPTGPWFTFPRPNPQARLRLFCFPYAGGGASIYRKWPDELDGIAEVCSVQLPGRGVRMKESPFKSLDKLVDAITEAIIPHLEEPFVFFGHSMGAMISFELARRLRKEGQLQPAWLFVSGRRAPQIPRDKPIVHDLPEPEFLKELRRLNGTPHEVLEHPELMQLMIPLLRGDFSMVETYRYRPEPPLECSVTAFGGLQDEEVSGTDLEGWREQTSADFLLHMLPGDHFFLNSAQQLLVRLISQELSRMVTTLR